MYPSASSPILTVYRRDGCHLCDDARQLVQVELERRATRGESVPRVREVDIETDPALHDRYHLRIPVLAIGDDEIELVTSGVAVQRFLERTLPALA
jgi:glutaredoxin